MAPVALAPAELVGIILETVIYGVLLILFPVALYILIYHQNDSSFASRSRFSTFVLCILISLGCSITAHWVLDVCRVFDAFIKFGGTPNGPTDYYHNLNNIKNQIKSGLYIYNQAAGDTVIVVRVYLIWGRNKWVVVLPCLCILGILGCGYTITWQYTLVKAGDIFSPQLKRLITSVFAFTISNNVYSSSMIAYKIMSTNLKVNREMGVSSLMVSINPLNRLLLDQPIVHIVIESAAIYTSHANIAAMFPTDTSVGSLFSFVAYLASSDIQFPAIDCTNGLVGVALCLLIVRIKLFRATQASLRSDKYGASRSRGRTDPNFRNSVPLGSSSGKSFDDRSGADPDERDDGFIMKPLTLNVAVNISGHVDDGQNTGESNCVTPKFSEEEKRAALPRLHNAEITNLPYQDKRS